MSNSVLWCENNDASYKATGDASFNYLSVHCASEHWLWHFGQFFILLAYVCGYISIAWTKKRYQHVDKFRGLIVFASCLLLVWADLIGQGLDHVIYYSIFLGVNFIHLLFLMGTEKTFEFDPHLDTLWGKLFSEDGYNLEAIDFYNLVQERAFISNYKPGMTYITEGDIPSNLSILLTGKMAIFKNDSYQRKSVLMSHHSTSNERKIDSQKIGSEDAHCGHVYPHEFIDSYEWLMSQGTYKNSSINGGIDDNKSQVTIKAADDVDECMVLTWKKELLEAVFKQYPRARTCIHALVGRDIAEKMLRVTGHSTHKNNPEVNMVRKAYNGNHHMAGAHVFPTGKTSFDMHTQARYDASELAAEIFDRSQDYHNCDDGKWTYWEGTILSVSNDGMAEVEWARSPAAPEEINTEFVAGMGTYMQKKEVHIDDLRLLSPTYETFNNRGIPKTFKDGTELSPKQKDEAFDKMRNGSGFCHERLGEENDLTVKATTPALTKVSRTILRVANMSEMQRQIKNAIGAGPWCELPDEVLKKEPWHNITHYADGKPVRGIPKPDQMGYHLLEQAKHSLQRSRLRVANSRLLGLNPGCLEALQPSSDNAEQDATNGSELLRYFEENCPDLHKKDLHEILKWGKWRTYYRPGTTLVRQGEEAHTVGIILQGRLAFYTEDEITRNKNLVSYADKFDLVGSEDFSSKFRTARRTIMLPKYQEPEAWMAEHEGELPPQVLPKHPQTEVATLTKGAHDELLENWKSCEMYAELSIKEGEDDTLSELGTYIKDNVLNVADKSYLQEREKAAIEQNQEKMLVTKIPTVMFTWDIKDLKRLMLADPKVEAALSSCLRSDITFKLNHASKSALASRMCGIATNARADEDLSCAPSCGAGGS